GHGGVTGRGISPAAPEESSATPASRSDDGEELIQLERTGMHRAVPEGLESAVERLGEALIARDQRAMARSCLPGVTLSEGASSALASQRLSAHRMVALASVGRHRLVKVRFEGPDGAAVIVTRWGPDRRGGGGGGWAGGGGRCPRAGPTRPISRDPLLSSVLVATRGGFARRIIRACRSLGIRSVAVYSEADRAWPFVAEADEAVAIGGAPAR